MNKLGTITSIEETTRTLDRYGGEEGVLITTTTTTVWMGISDGQSCCEESGYLMTEDDFKDYIGAELLRVEVTDTEMSKNPVQDMYEGGTLFVDIETSAGLLQFKAYNEHNGYYSHEVSVIIGDERVFEGSL